MVRAWMDTKLKTAGQYFTGNKKPLQNYLKGFFLNKEPDDDLLSRMSIHYHRREGVSLSCSGREGVGPPCYGRQA